MPPSVIPIFVLPTSAVLTSAKLTSVELYLCFADLTGADLGGADLSDADLSSEPEVGDTYLSGVNLMGTNLRGANFSKTDLSNVNLIGANLIGANLSDVNLIGADLSGADLSGADLREVNLSGTNLTEANLSATNLGRVNLSGFNLSNVDLHDSLLIASQLLRSNLTSATLTGACIHDWHINSATCLDNVKCEYVYLKGEWSEREKAYILSDRRPSSGNFAPGEFALLFKKALDTVDLIFADGIDWQAFFQSFQELRSQYGDKNIAIQAIEKKSGDAFVIRLEIAPELDKAAIESTHNEWYAKLTLLEDRVVEYKEEVRFLRQSNANLGRIVETMADKETSKVTQHFNAPVTAVAGNVEGNQIIYSPEQRQTLAEAAAEIQELLDQLSQTYPTNTTTGKMQLAAEAIAQIENNPTLMQRVLSAIQAGGTAALEQFLNHPAASFVIGAMADWEQTKEN